MDEFEKIPKSIKALIKNELNMFPGVSDKNDNRLSFAVELCLMVPDDVNLIPK